MEQLPEDLNLLRNAAAVEDGSDLLVLHQKWCKEWPEWGTKPQREKISTSSRLKKGSLSGWRGNASQFEPGVKEKASR